MNYIPKPHFKATITVTRGNQSGSYKGYFVFGEDCCRKVPIEMEGVEGLNTAGFWIEQPNAFNTGESFEASCCVLYEEAFKDIVSKGKTFKLWSLGYFAEGIITEVYNNWN